MRSLSSYIPRLARRGARALRALIAPDYCAACDAPVLANQMFCDDCGSCPAPPERHELAVDARVGGMYAPPLSTAILRMKFGQRADLADRLERLLPTDWQMPSEGRPLIVPVPLHFARLMERGFNPAALLALRMSERVGGRFAPRLLERCRDTPQQSRLRARDRRKNVEGAFVVRQMLDIESGAAGRHAVLIDDVITTGSTLSACRQALYAAGVVHVTVLALAAAPMPP